MRKAFLVATIALGCHGDLLAECSTVAAGRIVATSVAPRLEARLGPAEIPIAIAGTLLGGFRAVTTRESAGGREAPYPSSAPRYYRDIAPGTLLGVLTLRESWSDARGDEISATTYTVRYAVQPRMKDHFGTAEHSDFALLAIAADDDGATITADEAIARSRGKGAHPHILMLAPPPPEAMAPSRCSVGGDELLLVDVGGVAIAIVVPQKGPNPATR